MRALHLVALALVVGACGATVHATDTVSATPPLPPSASAAPSAIAAPPADAAAPSSSASLTPGDAATQTPPTAEADASAPPAGESTGETSSSACNAQPPQDFLIRGNFLKERGGNQRAIQYRTDQYGYVQGFGHHASGAPSAKSETVRTTFLDLRIVMNRRVVPALHCVEEEIHRTCSAYPYKARALAGIRDHNTYRGGEVTNHMFGIAIDIDPDINTCCGCVPPWNDAPRCKRPAKTEYDRMAMPECWVHAFERYGFYWLGHDVLRDTMHYEFLGDPDRILKDNGRPAPSPSTADAGP